jgi:hypothetical protein
VRDERLRELERRFKETGAVEDEANWLRARVRAGTLSEQRLQVAAYVGHALAAKMLVEAGFEPRRIPRWRQRSVSDLASGLSEFGAEVCARAALAMGPLVPQDALEDTETFAGGYLNRLSAGGRHEARVASERWLLCPCADCSRAASRLLQSFSESWVGPYPGATQYLPPEGGACRIAAHGSAYNRKGVEASTAAEQASRIVGQDDTLAALRNELAPWALGYHDPVRLRVAQRGGRQA